MVIPETRHTSNILQTEQVLITYSGMFVCVCVSMKQQQQQKKTPLISKRAVCVHGKIWREEDKGRNDVSYNINSNFF